LQATFKFREQRVVTSVRNIWNTRQDVREGRKNSQFSLRTKYRLSDQTKKVVRCVAHAACRRRCEMHTQHKSENCKGTGSLEGVAVGGG